MPKEIERKFAVRDLSMLGGKLGAHIMQGYITNEPMTVRVRLIDAEAFLTLKGQSDGIARDEFEFPIPRHHALELLANYCGERIVEKTRYRVPHGRVVFEVDVFSGRHAGLVIAEVELDHAEQTFDRPEWLGDELSFDKRFSNYQLATNPECPLPPGQPQGLSLHL